MSNYTETIKGALAALDGHHPDDMGELELTEQVELGAALWDIINRAGKLIDPIKERLRQEAIEHLNGNEGAHEFVGVNGGKATVLIPKASTKVRKGADMEALKEHMGEDLFDQAFTTTISYKVKPGLSDSATKIAASFEVDSLFNVIEISENTPRVNFRR
jgi:hypothetical protein